MSIPKLPVSVTIALFLALSTARVVKSQEIDPHNKDATELRLVNIQTGFLYGVASLMNNGFAIPLFDTNIGIDSAFSIGPHFHYFKDRADRVHWSLGAKANYFLNGRRFTTGPSVTVLWEKGRAYGTWERAFDNRFQHEGIYLTYNWYFALAAFKKLAANVSVSAGVGRTQNTDCPGDYFCGANGNDSIINFSGDGTIFPDLLIRAGVAF